MNRPLTAVLLAGRIRPSPLRAALDVHVLCLPVGPRGSLLDAWLEALRAAGGITDIQVVVNTKADVDSVTATAGAGDRRPAGGALGLRVIAEPAAWRGAGGILRDVTGDLPDEAVVLVCEAKRLPPPSLEPLLRALENDRAGLSGVVGVCGDDEPAGVYAFNRRAIGLIPSIGYFDMKEQFLPALARNGHRIATAKLGDAVWRLSDLESYLHTVQKSLQDAAGNGSAIRASDRASISGSAVLDGFCLIEPGAVIEDGAVVHNSVVLWGATVGGGAVVSQSVIGPLAAVEPRSRVVREFVAKPAVRGARLNGHRRRLIGEKSSW